MSKYILKTLGCKANIHDSQQIETELQANGWANEGSVELCIINSCTVTDEADRQTRKLAKKLAKENPNAKVVITGCGAEASPDALRSAPGVHLVIGNQNKPQLVQLIKEAVSSDILNLKNHPSNTAPPKINEKNKGTSHLNSRKSQHTQALWPPVQNTLISRTHSNKTRVFLKIQEGCDAFCTYCIIPYGRGPSRSLSVESVLTQVRQYVDLGVREIVITGTNIGDYGSEWTPVFPLEDLLERILLETSLERLRVSSLDPTEITPKIFRLMEEHPRFCPHFHVSLQSPHSRVLKLMKRQYRFEEVSACLTRISQIQNPTQTGGIFVGMDIITGFPGETADEFNWGLQALKGLPWTRLHVFPYSEREGTPATRLPFAVDRSTRVERARQLNQLSMTRMVQHYQSVLDRAADPITSVLIERSREGQWVSGYTPNYLKVLVINETSATLPPNELISVLPLDISIDTPANEVALVCKRL